MYSYIGNICIDLSCVIGYTIIHVHMPYLYKYKRSSRIRYCAQIQYNQILVSTWYQSQIGSSPLVQTCAVCSFLLYCTVCLENYFLLGLLCFVSVSSLSTEHVSIFGCFIMAQSDSVNTGINTSPSSPKSAATQDATISSSTASAALVPLSNTQQVINLKLTNNNYLFRRMQMKPYLIGQGVFSFFDGSTQYPSSYATDSSCSLLSV